MLALVITLLLQFTTEPTVDVILRDRTITLRQSEAEAWYEVIDPERDRALHVALTCSLGTVPSPADHPVMSKEEFRRRVACWWCEEAEQP